ncbi:aldo/keto reductase [Paenibacillus sp. GP183]|uniref:aldo/keto reductase n=1 Tax=Paenibacillus sp. GP183 TaxID=1882751 RepID=UPI00089C86BA|nr:aldo/keto reductase [Paenibacillus sp. GP183]SEB52982.1 Predicted oxidoreductase [Paenibacillus sp. GP183]
MNHRKLGRTGMKVSEISLGCMAFGRWIDEAQSLRVMDTALDAGITLFDTADVYGKGMDNRDPRQSGESEAIIGPWLKGKRERVILATKVHGRVGTGVNDSGQSRYHIMQAVENSLKRLQTDYIDLYQVHRFDEETPLDETLRALDDLIHQGKVRYIGCSNFSAWQIAKAHGISALQRLHLYESVQPQYSIIAREIERELLPFCRSEQVGVLVYSPLGRGFLTGKYRPGEAPPEGTRGASGEQRLKALMAEDLNYNIVDRLRPLAERRGWTLGQFALAWVLSNPVITSAILGVSKPEHILDAIKISGETLSHEEMEQVNDICGLPETH